MSRPGPRSACAHCRTASRARRARSDTWRGHAHAGRPATPCGHGSTRSLPLPGSAMARLPPARSRAAPCAHATRGATRRQRPSRLGGAALHLGPGIAQPDRAVEDELARPGILVTAEVALTLE